LTFWDFCAPFYDIAEKANNKARNGMFTLIKNLVPQNASVIEIAAGTGVISLYIADKAENVACTDVSSRMLAVAQKKAKKQGVANITFQTANIFDLDFEDNAFDVVIASQVLHLLDEPEKAAAELRRISKGSVIVPICLLKNISRSAKFKVWLFRVFGFAPKREFDADGYREFLTDIGLPPYCYEIADGEMPLVVAVWQKSING
jgi:ubiquinone/menaquinone biosynthesis C-methylase UbiE